MNDHEQFSKVWATFSLSALAKLEEISKDMQIIACHTFKIFIYYIFIKHFQTHMSIAFHYTDMHPFVLVHKIKFYLKKTEVRICGKRAWMICKVL